MSSVFLDYATANEIQNGQLTALESNTELNALDTNLERPQGAPLSETEALGAWYLTDTIAGQGPRPEYLESKYRSVEAQAKAYKDTRIELSKRGPVPDEYDLAEVSEFIDPQHPQVKEMLAYAKEKRLDQESVGRMMKGFVDYTQSFLPNEQDEINKIGPQTVDQIRNWAKANLSHKSLQALDKMPVSAEMFEALNEIRQMSGRSPTLPTAQQHSETFTKPQSLEEVKSELRNNYERYSKDEHYRKDLDGRLGRLVEQQGRR